MILKYLPPVNWSQPTPVTPAPIINDGATPAEDRQLTLAAEHAPIRTVYGKDRIGAQIANVAALGAYWVIQAIWCEGEIDSIDDLRINDAEELPAGTVVTHYNGTSGQGVDATLAAAISGYADTLPGIAYTVLKIPVAGLDSFPQVAATITGLIPSGNPALILRDFVIRAAGMGVNEASFTAVAAACDELVSGVKRRVLGITLDNVQDVGQWIDVLRTYASCWLVLDDDGLVRAVADRPASPVAFALAHDDGQVGQISFKKRGMRNVPTCVRVRYTDTSTIPWRDAWQEADSGDTPRRDSEVALPGIHDAAQAYREAVERLNKLTLCDLSATVEVFDEALKLEVGDVIPVTHPYGLDDKPMRVMGVEGDYGRYSLALVEYDPAVYSDAVASAPTVPDTTLPNPLDLPALTGLTAVEELVQFADGTWGSRIRMTWDAPTHPFLYRYNIVIEQAGVGVIDTRVVRDEVHLTPPVEEGITYICKVAALSTVGALGDYAQANVTALGKSMPPQPIPAGTFQAFEAGGTVYLEWGQAADIDVWRYRIKRGTTAQTYAQATQIDLVDALRYMDKTAPVGTWRYWVEVVDSVRLESGTPRSKDVVVTSDVNAFLVNAYDQTAPQWSNLLRYSEQFDNAAWAKTRSSISANATTAPDGALIADALIEDTTVSSTHYATQQLTGLIAGAPYSFSVYAKSCGRSRFYLMEGNNTTGSALFDVSAGTIISTSGNGSPTAIMTAVGNGWYRCSLTLTLVGTVHNCQIRLTNSTTDSYTGDGTSGIYIWGAQLVPGRYSEYQNTTNSAIIGGANMASFRLGPTDDKTRYVTEDGAAFGTKYSSNLATCGNVLATYHASITSTWLGEAEDFGLLLGGDWRGTADVSALSGSIASSMGFSADGSAYTYLSGLAQKTNGRFARMKHEALTTSTLLATAPTQNIRLDAIPREEAGTGTSSASGAVTITLSNSYAAVKKLTITPEGSTARFGVYDAIVLGTPTTFQVHVFNDAGARIASNFRYAFQGV